MKNIIDQTLLKPDAKREEFEAFCMKSVEYGFGCIAILPNFIKFGAECLKDSGVKMLSAVAYPRGGVDLNLKRFEIEDSLTNGAAEIDMVINLPAVKSGDFGTVSKEVKMLRLTAPDNIVKLILETPLLSEEEIITCCRIACDYDIDFVKTSTGYNGNIASIDAVALMKRNVRGNTRVKAAGGINGLDDCLRMIKAGAERVGTSRGTLIIDQFLETGKSLADLLEDLL